MPKEYVHWVLAEKAAQHSPVRIKKIINRNRHLYYLGAVAPDTPYYYLFHKDRSRFKSIANHFHGRDEKNSLSFLLKLFQDYEDTITDQVWAFLSGIVTHVYADATMHPVIYYFCGDPENKDPAIYTHAQVRHRIFESWLDIKYKRKFPLENRGKYAVSLKKLGKDRGLFHHLLHSYFCMFDQVNAEELNRNISMHAKYQGLFNNRLVHRILVIMNFFNKGKNSDIISLFYFSKSNHPFDALEEEFLFKHPATGKEQKTSFVQLEKEVVTKAVNLFTQLELAMEKNKVKKFLASVQGPHLDTGLFDYEKKMQYFGVVPLTAI